MDPPPGFDGQGEYANKVCLLRKSLYGLKQSRREWFERFSSVVLQHGFSRCQSDHTVFYRRSYHGRTYLLVYVDDIIITGDDSRGIVQIKEALGKVFEVKDLGPLKYFLGIEVARSPKGISLSQRKYVLDLLEDTGMLGCKPVFTPLIPNSKLLADSGDRLRDPSSYQRLVGRLIYLANTRPDISFVVSRVSQFMHAPCQSHLDAVYHILRYLKSCPGLGLFYAAGTQGPLECYTDSDYGGSYDSRSTTGFCSFRGSHLISWKSKKQSVVSQSSTEAEYRALALGTCEVVWLRTMLGELGFSATTPSVLHCDNRAAIHLASDSVLHERTKHVEIDVHFLREKVRNGIVAPSFVRTKAQIADTLTKPAGPSDLRSSIGKLGLLDIFAPA
ncbi:hypothetical protein ACHQM5_026518 [Ranunculus cassubicifolius]